MQSMTEAYGTDVPDTIGRFEYDQERSENVGGPIEDAYYFNDGNGHSVDIENHEWKEGWELSRSKYGPAVTDCLSLKIPIDDFETRQQAFEAAQKEFGESRLRKAVRTLLGGI